MADKLMVVAHPDDEVIFGGAHLLLGRNWKVVCITNARNRVRIREFKRAMALVGAEYEIWNYRDTYSRNFNVMRLRRDLQRLIRRNHFKKIVTHGLRGEYGHPQHKVIARILRSIVKENLYAFSIGRRRLPNRLIQRKRNLLKVYASQRKTIWELSRDDHLNVYFNNECFVRIK